MRFVNIKELRSIIQAKINGEKHIVNASNSDVVNIEFICVNAEIFLPSPIAG
jgi:hypothetical protein